MEKRSITETAIARYTEKLYAVTGKLNLYIKVCHKNEQPDINRLTAELQTICDLVESIKAEIKSYEKSGI